MGIKFNILNHTKPDSLFNTGMKVLVYSECINKNSGIGWHRDGRDIAYFQNNFKKVITLRFILVRIPLEDLDIIIHLLLHMIFSMMMTLCILHIAIHTHILI